MSTEPTPLPDVHPHPHRMRESSTKRVLVSSADTPHRVMTAGQTILFVILVLIIGTVLNAPSLYTRASTMKPSFARSASMTLLRPFDLVSETLGLTSLRRTTRSALDLPRDDTVDTFRFNQQKPTTPPPTTTLPMLSPTNKLTMWIVGDSLSITPGESMLRSFSTDTFDIFGADGQISTGLARPDVFNWFSYINSYVTERHPRVVIVTFGANDDQYLTGGPTPIGPFGTVAWRNEYYARVSSTLDFLAAQNVHTLWIAIPPVRDPVRNDRYAVINEVTREAVLAHPTTATLVETAAAFTNPDGSYSDSIVVNGTPTLLRAPDGIHFTRAGGDVIARLVIEKLHTLYQF